MTGPIVLTVDELRALDRCLDLTLPAFVVADDPRDLRVDVAALRGLALRGLITLHSGAGAAAAEIGPVVASPALERVLAPSIGATVIAELDIDAERFAVLAATDPPVAVLAEDHVGLVRLELHDEDALTVMLGLVRRTDESTGTDPGTHTATLGVARVEGPGRTGLIHGGQLRWDIPVNGGEAEALRRAVAELFGTTATPAGVS